MFILLLQTIWLFIAELAGKDLDFSVIIKFLLFATPRLIPMVLPLTILLASIMIFGNFAENYEFAAMKSSGISLQRAMRTLSVLMVFIGIGAFWFSNTVIPDSEKRFINLRKNIVKVKPAMVITQNQFNDLGNINIKVAEKYGDNDQFLKDVIIHKKSARPGNYTVIKATDGELKGSVDSDLITLILNDGNYYEEIQQASPKNRKKIPFAKAYFKQYNLNIDLSELDNVDMDAQQYSKGFNMLNVSELRAEIDTVSWQVNKEVKQTKEEISRRGGFKNLKGTLNLNKNTISQETCDTLDLITERFNLKEKEQIYNLAISNTDGVLRAIENTERSLKSKRRGLNKYEMSLHDKYVLGIACVLLFFVGAPLGAIIRKGGLGTPIVMGVLFFLTYHFIGIFAKNGAEEGGIPPFIGSWVATWIIFPLSIFLTYRATTDRGFISVGNYIQPIISFFWKKKSKDNEMNMAEEEAYIQKKVSVINTGGEVYQSMIGQDIDKLKDVVRNYSQYNYSEEYKFASLRVLLDKGVSIDEIRLEGKLHNNELKDAEVCFDKFNRYSVFAIIFSLMLTVVFSVIQGLKDSEMLIGIVLIVVTGTAYCITVFNAIKFFDQFYKVVKETIHPPGKGMFLLCIIPFNAYIFAYFFYRKGMKRDIKLIR
ncbi:hypothetical protein GCM10022393_19620 [Aquimarina addita]|uniref:Lipopolysaccharide export system permease protein n=2 Tax=Aquimarina addita TaxID=870485 RepID=A0ABP6UKL8_9FLAO